MAEIDIQKKKKPIWPWVVALLLALVVVWVIIDTDETEEINDVTTIVTEPGETGTENFSNEVEAYLNSVEDTSAAMGMEHEYTSSTLQELADALEYIADNSEANIEIQNRIEELNTKAEAITQDPESTQHADKIKDAFTTAAGLISELQQNNFPDLNNEAQQVADAAETINSNELILEQKEEIHSFFNKSAQIVKAMSMQIKEPTASVNNDYNLN